ncbi:MAG: hypothetical protein KAZ30_00720 [Candidatus Magasanikbacteria bacterium]|nr:hypothetical protein [Candidatus Magasanikbacteria bacterium]
MTKSKLQNPIIISLSIIFFGAAFLVQPAYSSTLELSTPATQVNAGDLVTVTVLVNTNFITINNAEADVIFSSNLLEFVSISSQESIFTSWMSQPNYSSQKGSISFNGGIPSPGYSGQNGKIFSAVFKAKSNGNAELFFSNAAVRANDGLGTNVLKGSGSLTINISTSQGPVLEGQLGQYFGEGDDTDGDGVPDQKEINVYQTDPNKVDTDGDGFNDGVEIINGYNPKALGQVVDLKLAEKFKGRILLQVQERGEAWYVNPSDNKRYYLGGQQDVYNAIKKLGMGISNEDLKKIPISLYNLENKYGKDSDGDGLPDLLEESLKTNIHKNDTDGDGYNDFTEIKNGYNPLGKGKILVDNNFTNSRKGRILLQVQGRGEAWYVNPVDGKRYFLGKMQDAYTIMKELGVGIVFSDLVKIKR